MITRFLITSFIFILFSVSTLYSDTSKPLRITIYPSKKEKTSLIDYCYALEKILSRNTVEKSKYISKQYQTLAKNTTLFGINKTRGSLAYMMVDQYKNSK